MEQGGQGAPSLPGCCALAKGGHLLLYGRVYNSLSPLWPPARMPTSPDPVLLAVGIPSLDCQLLCGMQPQCWAYVGQGWWGGHGFPAAGTHLTVAVASSVSWFLFTMN